MWYDRESDPDMLLNIARQTQCRVQAQHKIMTDYKKDTSTPVAAAPESELTLQEVMIVAILHYY
jgi:hypothetical protein